MMKKIDIKFLYLSVIILGSIFIMLPCFHENMWFDEAYSVGIASFNFIDIWNIGSHDVHPIMYYFILHIISLISNGSVLILRLFSCIPLIILGILGYTHIRKDFNERIGLLFSYLVFFMPVCLAYSGEIRMYTWSMLFVTLMSIYAFRLYKNGGTRNWVIFSIFSILSAYTHYYAMIIAFVENALLFIYFVYKKIKKDDKNNLVKSIVSAVIQIVLYLPWIGVFLNQTGEVSKGFWINDPDLWSVLIFQFTGNLDQPLLLNENLAVAFSIIGLLFIIVMLIRYIKESKAVQISLLIYILVIIIMWIISITIQPLLYARYFLNLTGLFLFILAFCISKIDYRVGIGICILIAIVSTIANVNLMSVNYDKANNEPFEYISSIKAPDDTLLFNNEGAGFIVNAKLNFKEKYFYNSEGWNVEEAYRAFRITETLDNLDKFENFKGRMWVISQGDDNLIYDVKDKVNNGEVVEIKKFDTSYRNSVYIIGLIETK